MTEAGSVYGQALYDLAKAENLSETIDGQLSALAESFRQEPDFLKLLKSPNLSKEEKCQVLDRSFQKECHPYVVNFLKILVEKGELKPFELMHKLGMSKTTFYRYDNTISTNKSSKDVY